MIPLLDSNRMRRLDRHAIETVGLPGALLMETAGRGVFAHLMERFGDRARAGLTAVVCGRGGNGGDGFVVARCLLNAGCEAEAFLDGRAEDVKGDARLHLAAYLNSGGALVECPGGEANRAAVRAGRRIASADLVVDALFGVGLSREPTGAAAEWIGWMGRTRAPVVSVDIPSGVSADDGRVLGRAVHADLTVTFGHLKKGHFFHPGRAQAGEVVVVDIGIPPEAVAAEKPDLWLLAEEDFRGSFRRAADSHKGSYGHVGVLAGSSGKMGAPGLVAWGALSAGAGLATAAYPAELVVEARFPLEVMTLPLPGAKRWEAGCIAAAEPLLAQCDALAVGPGLGTDDDAAAFLDRLLAARELPPLVLDADALTLLAARKKIGPAASRCLVTPHPGEAARLLSCDTAAVQDDREGAVREIARRYGCAVILKGAGTLVTAPGFPTRLVARGNPGMATAGSGDVLAGIAGAFLARGLPPLAAADAAAFVHALAGDLAAEEAGLESLTATDILAALPDAFRELEGG